ncbi:hypothetical protein BDA96_07G152400 [Sorghum bicolor]|jgi:hypothetical protein|uniref:Uncharacterized protein n=2 Tax=Sorghum bicolor TaxID=4558 RepID=A0A921UAM5_SORBI|nr:hypothetical protein BDA96_07G152400 [Sorghum bicolor]OQU80540.1 hypothetical protein SORBI_3007G141650 [Sorghum bicolor]
MSIPRLFQCPISLLAAGHHTCPFTLQPIGDAALVPKAPTAACTLQLGFLPMLLLLFHAPTLWDLSKQEDLALQCTLSLLPIATCVWQVLLGCLSSAVAWSAQAAGHVEGWAPVVVREPGAGGLARARSPGQHGARLSESNSWSCLTAKLECHMCKTRYQNQLGGRMTCLT